MLPVEFFSLSLSLSLFRIYFVFLVANFDFIPNIMLVCCAERIGKKNYASRCLSSWNKYAIHSRSVIAGSNCAYVVKRTEMRSLRCPVSRYSAASSRCRRTRIFASFLSFFSCNFWADRGAREEASSSTIYILRSFARSANKWWFYVSQEKERKKERKRERERKRKRTPLELSTFMSTFSLSHAAMSRGSKQEGILSKRRD